MGAVEGSTFSVSICVTSLVSVLCMCMCVWDLSSTSLLVDPAKGKVAATSFSLGLWAPGWALAARQEGPGPGLLEEAATSNVA